MKKTYRVAVIGSTGRGDYGHGVDVCWQEVPQAKIVAVADDDPQGLKNAADRLKVDRTFADYRQMLDSTKPDVVAIGTRWLDRHCEMATSCLERGIHIYMEKPFCRDLAEADKIIRAGEMTHAKLALAHTTRYSPRLAKVQQLIKEGVIGQVIELRGRGKEDATRGGGEDLWVLGSHILNLFSVFGGPVEWCFAKVRQNGHPISKADVVPGNEGIGPLAGDDVRATYGFQNGMTGTFQSLRGAAGNPSRFAVQIFGTKGIIEIATGYLPTAKLLEDSSWSPGRSNTDWKDISSAGVDQPEPLADSPSSAGNVAAVTDLFAAIEEERQPLCSASDGRATIEMILSVFESQRTGGPVAFPLQLEGHPLEQMKN